MHRTAVDSNIVTPLHCFAKCISPEFQNISVYFSMYFGSLCILVHSVHCTPYMQFTMHKLHLPDLQWCSDACVHCSGSTAQCVQYM